jgi:hypothetical protein
MFAQSMSRYECIECICFYAVIVSSHVDRVIKLSMSGPGRECGMH